MFPKYDLEITSERIDILIKLPSFSVRRQSTLKKKNNNPVLSKKKKKERESKMFNKRLIHHYSKLISCIRVKKMEIMELKYIRVIGKGALLGMVGQDAIFWLARYKISITSKIIIRIQDMNIKFWQVWYKVQIYISLRFLLYK